MATERGTHGALAVIVLLASALRLYNLGQGHPGLAIYSAISSNTTSSFHNWLYPSIYVDGSILADKPPVFFWVQGAFIALLGPTNLALRLPAALAGIASVVLLFVIVKRCHGSTAALLAALMLAVMPLDVNFSRGVFLEPVTSLTILIATYFVVRAVQDKEERYYYIAAAVLGVAFMVKLWQGLLPAPAFAVLALTHRWTTWPRFVRITGISAVAFLVSAFWWPTLMSLTSGAYDGVMHADSVWDMIFGWNLRERFGGLEYGSQHRQDIFWFVTGPMSLILGISLLPAALIGAATLVSSLRQRAANLGLLWLVWMAVAVIGFGGASVRLTSYWTSAMPAVAALSGIGIAALLGRFKGPGKLWWIAALGFLYCADTFWIVRDSGDYFRNASRLSILLAAGSAVWALIPASWTQFKGAPAILAVVVAVSGIVVLNTTVGVHNILRPRDDTLGRIGFDQVPLPPPPAPSRNRSPQPQQTEVQRQGSLITSIVRTEIHDLDEALDYVNQNRRDSRYLLAADTYNSSARVSLVTGEPILTLYSEYNKTRVTELSTLEALVKAGDVRFILTSEVMRFMDFELYAWLQSNTRDVSFRAGLPFSDEMKLMEVVDQ
ncbi:MAG: glycosyltransferase family 39 protein [SAR202 cluster bacterium]|jgi:4-amino-4-deoxy-L-arabinose transferase-like glycosyltransferase|nr:glycosyltransferase family 39 protein [SAR202 cluster bacterium]MDP6713330.1 glycosyltransferase family 39 protein [SAR202 cluster bacterium]